MAKFNIGDKVRIKDRPDWPSDPGYRFAGAEGIVVHSDFDELMEEYTPHMICVKLEKVRKDAKEYAVENGFWFLAEYVEKK